MYDTIWLAFTWFLKQNYVVHSYVRFLNHRTSIGFRRLDISSLYIYFIYLLYFYLSFSVLIHLFIQFDHVILEKNSTSLHIILCLAKFQIWFFKNNPSYQAPSLCLRFSLCSICRITTYIHTLTHKS